MMTIQELLTRLTEADTRDGLCRCGCGKRTKIPKAADAKRKYIKGIPMPWAWGHSSRKIPAIRVSESNCWLWQRSIYRTGYGQGEGSCLAHRMTWTMINGTVPRGLELDHICRTRSCVNPEHLRLVMRSENTQCGDVAKLNVELVRKIRVLKTEGLTIAEIARRVDRKYSIVHAAAKGVSWSNVA